MEELDVPILPKEPIPGEDIIFFKSDLSDLLDLCDFYLKNEPERIRIARNGYKFYWENLTPQHIAKYFLENL